MVHITKLHFQHFNRIIVEVKNKNKLQIHAHKRN
uniref:Uncharacterized protein n=1 Tax=Arundo donax TaxID=35708 RepID=A0A0A8ZRP8_ARUDO